MKTFLSYCRTLLELLLSPGHAWEEISARGESGREVANRLMLPLFILASVSVFFSLVYHTSIADGAYLADLALRAVATFLAYALAYMLAMMMFKSAIGRYVEEPSERKSALVVAYCMSLLALSTVVCNLLPVALGLPYLFTIVVTLVAWKANVYLRVKSDRELGYVIFSLFALALPPVLILTAFSWMLAMALGL